MRSKGERLIAEFLQSEGIPFEYEKEIRMKRTTDITKDILVYPDFFIKRGNIIIEYFGLIDDPKYQENIQLKKDTYRFNKYNLIPVYPTTLEKDWKSYIRKSIKDIRKRNSLWRKLLGE